MARSGHEPQGFDPAACGWSTHSETGLIDLVGPLWYRSDAAGMRLGFMARNEHVNRRGVVHGGMLLTLADQTLGMTAFEANGRQPQATVQLDVQFVAAVAVGDFVEAEAQVVRRTRSLIFMQGTFRVGDTTVATASGIWKIIGRKSDAPSTERHENL